MAVYTFLDQSSYGVVDCINCSAKNQIQGLECIKVLYNYTLSAVSIPLINQLLPLSLLFFETVSTVQVCLELEILVS
jgi:hypothetical protein